MIKLSKIILLTTFLYYSSFINAQDYNQDSFKYNRIGGFIGYYHYPGGAFNNYRSFFIASIGIEYDYKFTETWGFGLKLDFIHPNYSIPTGLGLPDIVIKYPSAMIKYYFSKYFNIRGQLANSESCPNSKPITSTGCGILSTFEKAKL